MARNHSGIENPTKMKLTIPPSLGGQTTLESLLVANGTDGFLPHVIPVTHKQFMYV